MAVVILHQRAGAGISAGLAEPMPVSTTTLVGETGYTESRRFAGRLEPARTSVLGFERAGKVLAIEVEEGAAVEAGDAIARLDTAMLESERDRLLAGRDALTAMADLARATDARQSSLTDRAVSAQRRDETRLQLAEAEARLAETDAALEGIAIELDKSVLRAPYSGHVAARSIDEGAIVDVGGPVVEVLETSVPLARIGLTPEVAAGLRVGGRYVVQHLGRDYAARLAALRPDIDPASRTVVARFDLDGAPAFAFGDTVSFDAPRRREQPGFWVPLSSLVEGSRGLWSLYTLEPGAEGPTIERAAVRVVTVRDERAYVSGALADGTRVVQNGTHRVIPGQAIRIAGIGEDGQ